MSENVFTGFPSPTKNFFSMPNEIINIIAHITNMSELKILIYIIRHTWGFHEYGVCKPISTDEFMNGRRKQDGSRMDEGTGLSNRSVIDGLRAAEKHGYLISVTDDSDKARTVKSYMLRMDEADVKILHTGTCEDTSYVPMKKVHTGYEESSQQAEDSSHRSEKDTTRNTPKKNIERQERTDASAIASAAPTPFSSQQEMEEIHIADTAPKASVSEQEDVPPDENENHSQESTQENSVGMVPHGRAKAVPPQEQKTPPKPRRTPPVHKDGVPTPERIEQVFVCMEGTIRRLTEQEDFTFGRTKKAKEAIKDLLQGRTVSQEKMDWHIVRLWHKPKDTKTGFWWRENMSVVAICNNYDREIVNYKPPRKVGASTVPEKTVSGKPRFEVPDDILEAMTATGGY